MFCKNRFTIYARECFIWEENHPNDVFSCYYHSKMMENSFKISVGEIVVHFGTFLTFLYGNNAWLTRFFCKGYGWLFFRNPDILKNPLFGQSKSIYTHT